MKKIISVLCVFLLLFSLCSVNISAEDPIVWVVDPVYDYIGNPASTGAPYFAYVKGGESGFMDASGNTVFGPFNTKDMTASSFAEYSDGAHYAIVKEYEKIRILKEDGSFISDVESFFSTNEMTYEPEIMETISKTIEGSFDKIKTVTYKNAMGENLLAPISVIDAGNFHSGVAVIKTASGSAIVDEVGNITPVNAELDLTGFYYEDVCIAKKGGKYGLVKLSKPYCISVRLDGKKVYFDQLPTIVNDRTLVPLRAIFEALNAEVEWNGAIRTVTATKGDTVVVLTIDSTTPTVNGETQTLDAPAMIINSRTMVPARFVAQSFGADVDWDGTTRTVIIKTK